MQQTSSTQDIAIAPEMRTVFERTHAMMSGAAPTTQQYPLSEQREMYLMCEVMIDGSKTMVDEEKTEDNLLGLIKFLHDKGIAVPDIIGDARCFGSRTRQLAMHLHLRAYRVRQAQQVQEAAKVVFTSPVSV